MDVRIEPSWKQALASEFNEAYFAELTSFVKYEYTLGAVYPPPKFIFRAFELTPFDQVKVVILGQDPYHGAGEANGLCFAVNPGVRLPPSLRNIYKELASDLSRPPTHARGDLEGWAKQGVLLLNSTLTVRENAPASHQDIGWERFTDAVVRTLSARKSHLVFILWGNYAKQKGAIVDETKHLVLRSPHPSPFAAHSGFFGSRPFSKTNAYLAAHGLAPVEW